MSGTKLWDLLNDCDAVEEYLNDACFDEEDLKITKAFQRIREFVEEIYEEEKETDEIIRNTAKSLKEGKTEYHFGIGPIKVNKEK